MSNHNGPFGLRPVRHKSGGTIRMDEYTIASADATGLMFGDVVKSAAAGGRIIEQAAAGDVALGVFAGCSFDDEQGRPKFMRMFPANQVASNIIAYVYVDPNITYLAQSTTIAAADIGKTCDIVVAAGDPTVGNSATEIDGATYGTGTALKVVALANSPDNAYGADANVEVIFVTSELED